MADVVVPELLQHGVLMTKVSAKRQKTFVFCLDPDQGQILWESKKSKIIPIENIKELRSASDARYYREQFQLAQEYEDRWLTIIYIMDGGYKTLHLIASTKDIFQMWDITLRKLYSIRQELMSGVGNIEMRQAVWEKQYWKGADEGKDQRLSFEEMEKLCKRLNINSSSDTLLRLFKQVDTENRGYLDFVQFQHFVKLLKARPELDWLYKKFCSANDGSFDFHTFETFMRDMQKSSLSKAELQKIFLKYATTSLVDSPISSSILDAPLTHPPVSDDLPVSPASSLIQSSSALTSSVSSSASSTLSSTQTSLPGASTTPPSSSTASTLVPPSASPSRGSSSIPAPSSASVPDTPSSPIASYNLTLNGFSAFLLSADNSAFTDQHGKIWHDMTRPLSEYFISTSHNTYLVGHQLVGVSTIEGYIRALLHSCRSVERKPSFPF
jgi:phosphatidylinositol phospholipase C delta